MTTDFATAMRRAAQLVRGNNVMEATQTIQRAIKQTMPGTASSDESAPGSEPRTAPRLINPEPDVVQDSPVPDPVSSPDSGPDSGSEWGLMRGSVQRPRKPLGEVVQLLRDGRRAFNPAPLDPALPNPTGLGIAQLREKARQPAAPQADGAQFVTRNFASTNSIRPPPPPNGPGA
jgi:hypothetical protein